jgi:hypothetical protein
MTSSAVDRIKIIKGTQYIQVPTVVYNMVIFIGGQIKGEGVVPRDIEFLRPNC